MIEIKPLKDIAEKSVKLVEHGKKSVLGSLPTSSNLQGALKPLESDVLCLSKPEIKRKGFASQAERLKFAYEENGVPYLLPHEEWSDKKILHTVKSFGKELDKLAKEKALDKEVLQEAIEKIIPELKGKIIIKDFADLENDLKARGLSEERIKFSLNSIAMSSIGNNSTTLYLKQPSADLFDQVDFKSTVEHELEHVLSASFQNTSRTDRFKNDDYKCYNQLGVFNKIFVMFEQQCRPQIDELMQVKITKKNMLKWLGFNSTKDLHKNFEAVINKLTEDAKAIEELNIGADKRKWKQFFQFMKNMSKDEKQAYKSEKRFREVYDDPNTSTNVELKPLLYGEMEKFFTKKWIEVNKNPLLH